MKLGKVLLVSAFVLPVLGAFATKEHHKKVPMVYYIEKTPEYPCLETPLPIACISPGSIICTLDNGPYYFQSNCTQPETYDGM